VIILYLLNKNETTVSIYYWSETGYKAQAQKVEQELNLLIGEEIHSETINYKYSELLKEAFNNISENQEFISKVLISF